MKSTPAILLLLLTFASPLAAAEPPAPPADLSSPPAEAERFESGLVTLRLAEGRGTAHPGPTDLLRMHVTAWRSDGSVVTHVAAPRTITIPVYELLPGWREAATRMVAGESRRIWIPSSLGGGKIPEGTSFVMDVEIVEILELPTPPADVAAPPDDALRTKSGLAYKVLRAGSGEVRPTRGSTVVVHYSGWTTDGVLFDSSVAREPATFGLRDVIRGWTEGLQLMTVGEKTRFWIPAKLAYGNEKGKPQGMLVFDVELLEVK
jgi:peptidylprolyl isomerase